MNDAPPTPERVGPAWTRRRWASVVTGLVVLVTGGFSVARWTLIPLEIDSTVADLVDRSLITRQVEMGVAIRMACLDVLTRGVRKVEGWR